MTGRDLADARTHAGLTQKSLASLVGVTQERVSEWEHDRRHLSRAMLDRVAAALGVRPAALLGELENLAELRRAAGLSQSDLAAVVGVSQRTYSRIEHGLRPLEPVARRRLSATLGLPQRRLSAAWEASSRSA